MGVFRPYIILSRYFAYEKVIAVQALLVGMMAVITIILSGCMIYMRRRVLKPIKTFSENLTRLEETDAGLDLKDTVRCYSLAISEWLPPQDSTSQLSGSSACSAPIWW